MEIFRFRGSALLKKRAFLLIMAMASLTSSAQVYKRPTYEPPTILTPSPTTAGFMRYTEVPVDNYTGIPDISIPLYSVQTHSKDISINLSLNYHPSSIVYEENSSDIGLGWSFIGGGTISRTVRGMPDESNFSGQYGINNELNPYLEAITFMGPTAPNDEDGILPEYIWGVDESGRYDSQYDLYQFSFMGHSGRFILVNTCTINNPCYEVKKLDNNNNIDIKYLAGTDSFELYDDKGYKFVFSVKEKTTSKGTSNSTPFGGGTATLTGLPIQTYVSAYHLTSISDRQNNLLVNYNFFSNTFIENNDGWANTTNTITSTSKSEVLAQLHQDCDVDPYPGRILQPEYVEVNRQSQTLTKKLRNIDVVDFANIEFTRTAAQLDTENLNGNRLSRIKVYNKKGTLIKDIELVPDYSILKLDPSGATERKRMLLKNVREHYGTKTLSYTMDYMKRKELDDTKFYKDYWGFTTAKPDYEVEGDDYKESHPFFCQMDILQKMKIPTGGSILYDWEINTYSYIGATALTNFDSNPFNWETTSSIVGSGDGYSEGSLGTTYTDIPYDATAI